MMMLTTIFASEVSLATMELLAQEGVSRVAARSGSGMVIDIILVVACFSGILFGICRSSLRR
ncbi:hypothetical protein [Lacunimicrobium album]